MERISSSSLRSMVARLAAMTLFPHRHPLVPGAAALLFNVRGEEGISPDSLQYSTAHRSHKETAGDRPEGAATQLQTLGCNGHRVQSPGPRGMGWPSGFAGPANALRAKEAGDGF